MKTFDFRGTVYNINRTLNDCKINDDNLLEDYETSRTFIKTIRPWFPIIVNNRLHWLVKCKCRFRVHFIRYREVDIHHRIKWTEWKSSFIIEEVIKKEEVERKGNHMRFEFGQTIIINGEEYKYICSHNDRDNLFKVDNYQLYNASQE